MLSKIIKNRFIERAEKLKKAGYDSYQDYLNSNEWQSIKKRINRRKLRKKYWNECFCCGKVGDIQIHHTKYSLIGTGRINTSLFPLCGKCHNQVHKMSYMKKYQKYSLKGIMKILRKKLYEYKTKNKRRIK